MGIKVAVHEVIRLCHSYQNRKYWCSLAVFKSQNEALAILYFFKFHGPCVSLTFIVAVNFANQKYPSCLENMCLKQNKKQKKKWFTAGGGFRKTSALGLKTERWDSTFSVRPNWLTFTVVLNYSFPSLHKSSKNCKAEFSQKICPILVRGSIVVQ